VIVVAVIPGADALLAGLGADEAADEDGRAADDDPAEGAADRGLPPLLQATTSTPAAASPANNRTDERRKVPIGYLAMPSDSTSGATTRPRP